MEEWFGSAAVCINEKNEILMVKGYGSNVWAIPSGGMEEGETPEECCIREVVEETGYQSKVVEYLFVKETKMKGIKVKVHYFKVKIEGESLGIDDPDQIIAAAEWKSLSELLKIELAYPEDLDFLVKLLKKVSYF